ncbi:hypothetical protein FBU30_004277 [Linnemannia zychae]|nr:hypothetical protein FBU30_004277 [Linnemannia zychae]
MAAEGPPGKNPPEKALFTDSTHSEPLTATGNDSEIEMLVVRALRKLVGAFSNVCDETEPYDPTNEVDNTDLTESDAIPVSGDSTGTSADSVDELGEDATSVGFFEFAKVSFAHLGSLSDTWKQFITTVEPAARRCKLQQDWDDSKRARREFWSAKKDEEEAIAEQKSYMKTLATAVMTDKTGTATVVDKRYRNLIEQELRSDSVPSTSVHDGDEDQIEVTCPQDECGSASTHRAKRLKNTTAVDEAMKLFKDSPLFDIFAYIFKKAQGDRHNPLPSVPSTEMSPNIRRLALYAQSELSKSSNSEKDLKNLYELFGKELVHKIEMEARFEAFDGSRIDEFLSQLRNIFSHSLDVKHLMDEISLRLAGIVSQE